MNEQHRRRVEALRADQAVVRDAAAWVRRQAGGRVAVLDDAGAAALLAELLDAWADRLDCLDVPVRELVVRVCREFLGDGLDQPARRRTRRRG